jgi:hypothetical protein
MASLIWSNGDQQYSHSRGNIGSAAEIYVSYQVVQLKVYKFTYLFICIGNAF